ncbi:MAG: hypothetical protein K0R84_990 [Clostridia bacterium]|jgi:tetratricopeptide (TPR) repeat protein|nr:hypothetical protein [Clostridia bacterium]
MLTMIKDANNNLDDEELERIYAIEEQAISHLEKRQYKEAAEKFEQVVTLLPNAVPARNNLSLSYYYLGDTQKAIEFAREVLSYEKYNIHANCNIAIFYRKLGLDNWVEKQIKEIKKISTDNPEYLYKIADTLGLLEKHTDAYKVYKKLLSVEADNTLYTHYAAVAAFNSGKYNDSIKHWKRLKQLDSQNLLSDYYINLAQSTGARAESEKAAPILTYSYQLPKEEIDRRVLTTQKFVDSNTEAAKDMLRDKAVEEALYYSIFLDRVLIRKLIFNKIKIGLMIESQDIIRKLLLSSDMEDEIKVEAIFLLDIIGAPQPYKVNFAGEVMEITADPLSIDVYAVNGEWEDIIKKAHMNMKGLYKGAYKRAVEDMWMAFIKYRYPNMPQINKIEEWAAALEYVYCRLNSIKKTQKELAEKYGVSISSFGNKCKQIMESIVNRADYAEPRKK